MAESTVIPLPGPDEVLLVPPSSDEVHVIAGAVRLACAPADGLTPAQRAVLRAVIESMTGVTIDVEAVAPITADEFGEAMRYRDAAFRTRMVQLMLLGAMLLVPLPPEVIARVEEYAGKLGVADDMLRVARRIASGSLGLALIDFERSGYFDHLQEQPTEHLHTTRRPVRRVAARRQRRRRSTTAGPRSSTARRARSGTGSGGSTGPAVSRSRESPTALPRRSRSTTGSTCSPTTAPPSSRRSRCSV